MSQKNFQIFRSQISDLKTDNVDYLKKPPWKKFFFDIFVIHLSSRYKKQCRMLQRLFSLFQGSKNQLWSTLTVGPFNATFDKKTHATFVLVLYFGDGPNQLPINPTRIKPNFLLWGPNRPELTQFWTLAWGPSQPYKTQKLPKVGI